MEEGETLAPEETEELLRRALELTPQGTRRPKKSSVAVYLISLAISALELAVLIGRAGWRPGSEDVFFWLLESFGAVFGAYFFLLVKNRLPKFYDENRINYYTDGLIRIHMAGVSFNNKNWPRILTAFRAWSASALVIAPALCYALDRLTVPDSPWRIVVTLAVLLGGLFIPAYIAAAKK